MFNRVVDKFNTGNYYRDKQPGLETFDNGLYQDLEDRMANDGVDLKLLRLNEEELMKDVYNGLEVNLNKLQDAIAGDNSNMIHQPVQLTKYTDVATFAKAGGCNGWMILKEEIAKNIHKDLNTYTAFVTVINKGSSRKYTKALHNVMSYIHTNDQITKCTGIVIDEKLDNYWFSGEQLSTPKNYRNIKPICYSNKEVISNLVNIGNRLNSNILNLYNSRLELIKDMKLHYENSSHPERGRGTAYNHRLKEIDFKLSRCLSRAHALLAYPIIP